MRNHDQLVDLTILTVSYGHRNILLENIRLTRKKNPDQQPQWIIIENTPGYDIEKEITGGYGEHPNVLVLKGPEQKKHPVGTGSYHHAAGLMTGLELVKTKFLLVLDPDFFIVFPNWIKVISKHMKENQLSFFGAPYHPKRIHKYKDFPCVHCMFINLSLVNKNNLDFMPDYNTALIKKILYRIKKILGVAGPVSRDTGIKIFSHFKNSKYQSNQINTVTNKDRGQFLGKKVLDSHCNGWDEFEWDGSPFGFHLQGAKKEGGTLDHSGEIDTIRKIIE